MSLDGLVTAVVAGRTGMNARGASGLPDEEYRAAGSLLMALEPFKEIADATLPLQHAITLLTIAMDEGRSQTEYARRLGLVKSTMSRHTLDLSVKLRGKPMGSGYDLITARTSPHSLKEHSLYLTPKGRTLVHRVLRAWLLGRSKS